MDDQLNGSPKPPMTDTDENLYPLVGNAVMKSSLPGKSDTSDWIDLMEVVEAPCLK